MQQPEVKYHWKAKEEVSEGLQRIVSEQLQLAIWQLSENTSLDHGVHEARKSLKKTRSAMRLMQGALGAQYDEDRSRENQVLREAGRKLSLVRDSQALIEAVDELNEKYREKLADRSLVPVRDGLEARKKELTGEFRRRRVRASVLRALRGVEARVEKWDLAKIEWLLVSKGFARTIRRNREARDTAYSSSEPEAFHDWRKRAKDLRYHLSLVGKAWPKVFDGYEEAAEELESKLGDDHNLVVLKDTILEKPGEFGGAEEVKVLVEILDDRQKELRSETRFLAERFYSEKPREWRKRLDLCWTLWKDEKSS